MSDVYDPDPENGPAAVRERSADREFLSSLPSRKARDAYYAKQAEINRRAATAAPVVGQAGMNKVDPKILAALLKAMGK